MSRLIKIGEAARLLGVSVQTLRKWERKGELVPDRKSEGGTRYYDRDHLLGRRNTEADLTIAYAGVSSHDQKDDLKRQARRLESYCTAKGWTFEVIQDLGSGMNYRKRGPQAAAGLDHQPPDPASGADPQRPAAPFWRGTCIHIM